MRLVYPIISFNNDQYMSNLVNVATSFCRNYNLVIISFHLTLFHTYLKKIKTTFYFFYLFFF